MEKEDYNNTIEIFEKFLVSEDTINIEIKYPEVKSNNKLVEYKINQEIIELINNIIDIQYKYIDNIEYMSSGYSIELNKNGILSILFDNYVYWKDAIHGITYIKSINLNIQNGKKYKLDGLFKKNINLKEEISNIIKSKIYEQKIYLIKKFDKINENQDFYLTSDCLVIYFQVYEYTSYQYGFLKIEIPYNEMKNIINIKSPIQRL